MTDSHSAFIGNIPHNYEKYLGPLIFNDYAEDLASRISLTRGGSLLEVAAGTGLATRQLRDSLSGDIRIVATDLNADMLDIARTKFAPKENIEFQIADALDLPFEDASYDAVACQFSVMFFPDKSLCFQEVARVLKPEGKFHFNLWDSMAHNHLIQVVNKAINDCSPTARPIFLIFHMATTKLTLLRSC